MLNLREAETAHTESESTYAQTTRVVLGAGAVGIALSVLLAVLIVRGVSGGIASVVRPMRHLTGGDLAVDIPHQGERTEIGTIADAVQVFKENLIRARALEAETAQARLAAEEQRKAGMREMADGFEAAGKARMHTCLDQYNANKAAGGNGGMNWIVKGGGYYSECNKRLKG